MVVARITNARYGGPRHQWRWSLVNISGSQPSQAVDAEPLSSSKSNRAGRASSPPRRAVGGRLRCRHAPPATCRTTYVCVSVECDFSCSAAPAQCWRQAAVHTHSVPLLTSSQAQRQVLTVRHQSASAWPCAHRTDVICAPRCLYVIMRLLLVSKAAGHSDHSVQRHEQPAT